MTSISERYKKMGTDSLCRHSQAIESELERRKLLENNLSVEIFVTRHKAPECSVDEQFVGFEPSGFKDADGNEHSARVVRFVCLQHGTFSESFHDSIN